MNVSKDVAKQSGDPNRWCIYGWAMSENWDNLGDKFSNLDGLANAVIMCG